MGWAWGGENLVGVLALGRVGTHWSRTGPLNPTHFWHWKSPCGSIFALMASSFARPSVPQTLSCNETHCSSFSALVSVTGQSADGRAAERNEDSLEGTSFDDARLVLG